MKLNKIVIFTLFEGGVAVIDFLGDGF
jgi:hypothetical protein